MSAKSLYLTFLFVACILSAAPVYAEDNYALAVTLYTAKKYAESERLLSKQIVADPNNAEAHYYLASCYHYQHKLDEARKEYSYIAKNFPNTEAAKYALQALGSIGPGPGTEGKTAAPVKNAASDDFIPDEEWIPYTRAPSGHFFVKAYINGRIQEIMFDTGAEVTTVNSNQWRQLGMPLPSRRYDGAMSGVAGRVNMWGEEAEVSLGKIKKHIKVCIADNPSSMALLGESFFGDLEYNMDSRAGYIHFFKKGAQGQRQRYSLQLHRHTVSPSRKEYGRNSQD